MAETQLAFQIASSLASQHLTDSKYIQGGYIVVKTIAERDALKVKTATEDGVIVEGSLVYVSGDKKSYRYTNNAWTEETAGSIYDSGTGIDIDSDNKINVKIDNDSIKVDSNGNLYTKVGTDYKDGQGISFDEEKTGQGKQVLVSNAYWCNYTTGEEYNQCTLTEQNYGGMGGTSQSWIPDSRAKQYNLKFKFENKFEDMYDLNWFIYRGGQRGANKTITKDDILQAKKTFEESGSFVWFVEPQNNANVTLLDIQDNYFIIKIDFTSYVNTYFGEIKYHEYLETKKVINANVDNIWTTVNADNQITVTSAVSSTINAWKDVPTPPSATDNKYYGIINNTWQELKYESYKLSDTVITATNKQGDTELQSVVSLSLGEDGLLKFNNGKLI